MENERFAMARAHRNKLMNVTFVGITGSCGKTTTKDLAAGLLSHRLTGSSNPGSGNCGSELIEHVLSVEPNHDFCIQELGAWGPGTLDAGLELVRPDVAVVLNIRRDHYSAFHGLEHTQAEKAKLVQWLPATGTAILNTDDPYVWAMRERTRAKILGFGSHPDAAFRMEKVSSVWPSRMSFELSFQGKLHSVNTHLLGEHLVGSAVAAIAIAYTLGISLAEATMRIEQLPPTIRRMSSVVTRTGVTVIRDDFKATSDSLGEVLHFIDQAHAERKIAVVGRISDHPGRSRRVYEAFAQAAAKVVDLLIFVGDRAADLWRNTQRQELPPLQKLDRPRGMVRVFETVRDASRFLSAELRSGDLLLLKGSGPSDHLERILLDQETNVQCWRSHCGRVVACDECDLLSLPANPSECLRSRCDA